MALSGYGTKRWVPENGPLWPQWPPVAPASPNPHFPLPGRLLSDTGTQLVSSQSPPSPSCSPTPEILGSRGTPPCTGTSASQGQIPRGAASHSGFAQSHPREEMGLFCGTNASAGTRLRQAGPRRGQRSSTGALRRTPLPPPLPDPPPPGQPGPCGRPRPCARGGAERRRRPEGAAVSAGPAARGDAALQLGAHGHGHYAPEAVRRRRPRPAEGARGNAGGTAGRSRGKRWGAKRPFDTHTRPHPPGLPEERFFSCLLAYFRCFQMNLRRVRTSFCAFVVGAGRFRALGVSCKAFVSDSPWLFFWKPARKVCFCRRLFFPFFLPLEKASWY